MSDYIENQCVVFTEDKDLGGALSKQFLKLCIEDFYPLLLDIDLCEIGDLCEVLWDQRVQINLYLVICKLVTINWLGNNLLIMRLII